MITIDETNPHYNFSKYWESIGCPKLEYTNPEIGQWLDVVISVPVWFNSNDYRIKGDRHWQLRKEWVNSGYKLPIEINIHCKGKWIEVINSKDFNFEWPQDIEFRKAEPKQERIMTETKELPELIKGKKLEKVDVPISTLPDCLKVLADGYVLEFTGGFVFLDDDKFALFDFQGKRLSLTFTFPPFIAAYTLTDLPWWENIPDGGVLCKHVCGAYGVVTAVKEKGGDMFAVVQNRPDWPYLKDLNPVTDEWLESMKCGF